MPGRLTLAAQIDRRYVVVPRAHLPALALAPGSHQHFAFVLLGAAGGGFTPFAHRSPLNTGRWATLMRALMVPGLFGRGKWPKCR